ncbi:MAG: hypothetical protein AB3X41_09260 [Leptothrix ochracea]|uniref:hypothetical protein n=1 Tax=Leptothrix ochracea TaxID=735331 RepID=UPI0034E22A36
MNLFVCWPRCASTRIGFIVLMLGLLEACVMVPSSKPYYDADCHVTSKQFELEPVMLEGMQHCHGEDCAALLAATGIVAAASAVISGSIMVLGNVAYWLERQEHCKRS